MGYLESWVVHLHIIVQQNIKINVSGPLVYDLLTPHGPFDVLQFIKELQGL